MHARIKVLDDLVVNQIAAGEVVERPASVVKELVENAMDAGARTIDVHVEAGGVRLIRVSDDGIGMSREDALICFERHATSKIESARDLFSVSSLGFRGEALASIAAVSRVELKTCAQGSDVGTRILFSGGKMELVEDLARVPGATVAVRHLFYNVPVRKGYLRSRETETRVLVDTLFRLAVARPGIGITLTVDKRKVWTLPPASGLKARLSQLLGAERVDGLLPVRAFLPGIEIEGWVQPPGEAKPGRRQQVISINGRPAESPAIRAALAGSFQGAVAPGARIQAYLLVTIDPGTVDVNVHPSKREVRFRDPGRIRSALITTLRQAATTAGEELAEELAPGSGRVVLHPGVSPLTTKAAQHGEVREEQLTWEFPPVRAGEKRGLTEGDEGRKKLELRPGDVPLLQIARTYIVAPLGDSVIIFDQHACHERVLYEETLRRLSGARAMAQQLLFPLTVELSAREAALAEEFEEEMRRVGFELRRFGETTYIVEAVPADMVEGADEELMRRIIAGLGEDSGSMAPRHHRVASSIACHSAIRAGEELKPEQMRGLIDRLLATDLPHSCPHGRPTFIQITPQELQRRFKRT